MDQNKGCQKAVYCAFLGKAANAQIAEQKKANMVDCPYVTYYEPLGDQIYAFFTIPENHRWWLTMLEDQPELLGLEAVRVGFMDQLIEKGPSSPWSRGETKPVLDRTPCDCFCPECGQYQKNCEGCPASKAYSGQLE